MGRVSERLELPVAAAAALAGGGRRRGVEEEEQETGSKMCTKKRVSTGSCQTMGRERKKEAAAHKRRDSVERKENELLNPLRRCCAHSRWIGI